MSPAHVYTDAELLRALRNCQSAPVRRLVIELDIIARFLRCAAMDPLDAAADRLNNIGMSLLELASAKQRRA